MHLSLHSIVTWSLAAWSLVSQGVEAGGTADTFFLQLKPCPASCGNFLPPQNWTGYHDIESLAVCEQPLLLNFAVYNPIDDPETDITILACTTGDSNTNVNALLAISPSNNNESKGRIARRDNLRLAHENKIRAADQSPNTVVTKETVDLAWWGTDSPSKASDVVAAAQQVQRYLEDDSTTNTTIVFGYVRGVLVGVYSGPKIENKGAASEVIQKFIDRVHTEGIPNKLVVQLCNDRNSDYVLGLVVDTSGDFAFAQEAIKRWSDAECVKGADKSAQWTGMAIQAKPPTRLNNGTSRRSLSNLRDLESRAVSPKPDPDGTCHAYDVQPDDTCSKLAAANSITVAKINSFNTNTWGWTGCDNLQAYVRICLSTGLPPMPRPDVGAVCGPTKAGTSKPSAGQKLADLNPCPLKACCNIWGQCGTTAEFCIITKSETGAPGTAAPKTSGCIQNCGMDIVNNANAPAQFAHIGYYEAWNYERPCLQMDVRAIKEGTWSHIHYSFATVTTGFALDISKVLGQWENFKKLKAPTKRILAIGGWTFSSDLATYNIFRQAVTPGNREVFATNCANFVAQHGIDGLDFDWEYPGAPDSQGTGIPPGNADDGENYFQFLSLLRRKLPSGKSLSIAAPASFWYLKAFPIDKMSNILNYIIYMTYDLHGQWDYANKWSSSGCPSGNCLRSHVNMTETMNALVMITKAGVPTNKIMVGVTSYGRSFKMTDPNCLGPMCTYVGPISAAKPGQCTETAGYISNAEIKDIISGGGAIQTWFEEETATDYLVYEGTEWVAYMSTVQQNKRWVKFLLLNFGGTTEWAIDLDEFLNGGGNPDTAGDFIEKDPWKPCTSNYTSLDDIANAADSISYNCGPLYILRVLRTTLQSAWAKFDSLIDDNYDKYYNLYADNMVKAAPAILTKFCMDNSNKYFTCVVKEIISCCSSCGSFCKHCEPNEATCAAQDSISWFKNITEPCAPDYSQRVDGSTPYLTTTYWSLTEATKDAFWADLLNNTGIDQKFIAPTTITLDGDGSECDQHHQCPQYGKDIGVFGMTGGYSKAEIPNPKDVIAKAREKLLDLSSGLDDAIHDIELDNYYDDPNDFVDAVSIPILMIEQAVKSMEEIIKLGEKIEEEKIKNIILAVLSAILLVIPFLGEALAGIAGMANIGRMVALFGEVGNVAFSIQDIITTPGNAPVAIFDVLAGAGALADALKISKAAEFRRAMPGDIATKLGGDIKPKLDKISVLVNACKRQFN